MKLKFLSEYIKVMENNGILTEKISAVGKSGKEQLENNAILGLSYDSRRCKKNDLFFCKGKNFKKEYLEKALQSGICAVVFQDDANINTKKFKDCAFIKVNDIRRAMAVCAAFHYDYPMEKAITVAVTGTKGKSGTVSIIKNILNEGNTFNAKILNEALPTSAPHLTTPEAIDFHKAAYECVSKGATHVICEISSQAQKTLRTYGIVFDIALFLNFGIDHISPSEHESIDDYFKCKASLFSACKRAVVNLDCEKSEEIKRIFSESNNRLPNPQTTKNGFTGFSFSNKSSDFFAEIIEETGNGYVLSITENTNPKLDTLKEKNYERLSEISKENEYENISEISKQQKCETTSESTKKEICVTAPGIFNTENALGAYCVCRLLGSTENEAFRGILSARTEGRMEILDTMDGKVRIIVDYAHNKMSFEALFDTVKRMYAYNPPKISAIFGCSGNKAYGRRYELPEVALKHADRIIICEEDSESEDFESIKNDILENIKTILFKSSTVGTDFNYSMAKEASVSVIKDRGKAIQSAVNNAFENGEERVILFTGKGREKTILRKNVQENITDDVSASLLAIKEYNAKLKLDLVFSRLSEKAGSFICICCEDGDDIAENLAVSAVKLLNAKINVLAICNEKNAEKIKEICYKNGVVTEFSENTSDVLPHAASKRGALSVIKVGQKLLKNTAKEIAVRKKADILVYLTRNSGIMLNSRVSVPYISERAARLISEKSSSPYLSQALSAIKNGVSEVAVIDGRQKYSLALYGTGAGYIGTVIKKTLN